MNPEEAPKPRLRLVGYSVQGQYMVDDGENLTPLNDEPGYLPAAAIRDGSFLQAIEDRAMALAEAHGATL